MEEIINNFKYKQMNKEEEKEPLLNNEGAQISGCDVNADRCLEEQAKKKRDTSFVDERKKQIELYGNYYPAGLSDEGIIEWANLEIIANEGINENLRLLKNTTESKIESDRQAKLAEIWNKLSESEKQQLKSMPV